MRTAYRTIDVTKILTRRELAGSIEDEPPLRELLDKLRRRTSGQR